MLTVTLNYLNYITTIQPTYIVLNLISHAHYTVKAHSLDTGYTVGGGPRSCVQETKHLEI